MSSIRDSLATHSPSIPCWVSLGGNLGDVKSTFESAIRLLDDHHQINVMKRSSFYRTVPMGSLAGDSFLNSVCGLITEFSPHQLLDCLQSIETKLGRTRDIRWGPRTLDLDILIYGNQTLDEPDLKIPHPGILYRRFVLDPLVEIAPDWIHPIWRRTAKELQQRLLARPLVIAVTDLRDSEFEQTRSLVEREYPGVQLIPVTAASQNTLLVRLGHTNETSDGHSSRSSPDHPLVIDLSTSPGSDIEKLSFALSAMLDTPQRLVE